MVQSFVTGWERDRPLRAGQFGSEGRGLDKGFVSAVGWLSATSGISADTIYRVKSGKVTVTEYYVADALVIAMGKPEAMSNGTFHVEPNPWARTEVRAQCCGSLTGAVSTSSRY